MKAVRAVLTGAFAFVLIVLCIAPFAYVLLRSFWTNGGITFNRITMCSSARHQYLFRFWKALGWRSASRSVSCSFRFLPGTALQLQVPGAETRSFLLMILMTLPVQVMLIPII